MNERKEKEKKERKKKNKNFLWKALQQDYMRVVHELSYGTNLIQNLTWFYKCTTL